MSTPKPVPNPERLVDGRFGRLLKDANREFAEELDQRAAFQRVTQRLSTSRTLGPARSYWLVPAALFVLVGVVALPKLSELMHQRSSGVGPVAVAEDLRGFHARRAPSPAALSAASASLEPPRASAGEDRRVPSTKLNGQGSSAVPLVSGERHRAPPSASESLEPTPSPVLEHGAADAPTPGPEAAAPTAAALAPADLGGAPDCLSLARRGQTRQAEGCFLKRAEGAGLGAEMALYEVARLRRDVLADAPGALAALAEYRVRFPAGSLRREADMSQLELLLQLGRSDEALQQSDELLSSSSSGERAAELHLLRGHIFRKAQGRFAEAAHEYELAESAGMRGGELSYFRALCLEALGRAPEAAALFSQYLEQPQRAYSADARRRLQRLNP